MKKKPPGNIYRNWREWEKALLAKVAEVNEALLKPRVVRKKAKKKRGKLNRKAG